MIDVNQCQRKTLICTENEWENMILCWYKKMFSWNSVCISQIHIFHKKLRSKSKFSRNIKLNFYKKRTLKNIEDFLVWNDKTNKKLMIKKCQKYKRWNQNYTKNGIAYDKYDNFFWKLDRVLLFHNATIEHFNLNK